jgi:hypothetical protein
MKLDIDPFPIGMVELLDRKLLLCTDRAKIHSSSTVFAIVEI